MWAFTVPIKNCNIIGIEVGYVWKNNTHLKFVLGKKYKECGLKKP